jgi:general secretion pathway protein B
MSMILDALKKADAERQLGELPGLHTSGWPGVAPVRRAGLWRRTSTWLVLAVPVLILAGLFWLNRHDAAPLRVVPPLPAPAVLPALLMPPPRTSNEIAMPPLLPREVQKEAPKGRREAAAVAPDRKEAAGRLLTLATLPANLQRELPALSIGGSMYSDVPAERMLLIDKRLLKEGEEVAPGLVLDSILPNGAILRYKGVRFQLMQ